MTFILINIYFDQMVSLQFFEVFGSEKCLTSIKGIILGFLHCGKKIEGLFFKTLGFYDVSRAEKAVFESQGYPLG